MKIIKCIALLCFIYYFESRSLAVQHKLDAEDNLV